MLDRTETFAFLELLERLDIPLLNITAGSPAPRAVPAVRRLPAARGPASRRGAPDRVVRTLKRRFPALIFVRSAYSYLHEWLHAVAAELVRRGFVDSVDPGRMMLSYPDLPHDVLDGLPLARKRICRTLSDCTTAPRKALISRCFPLDPCYEHHPDAQRLPELKAASPP